jgi:hypothetical protein
LSGKLNAKSIPSNINKGIFYYDLFFMYFLFISTNSFALFNLFSTFFVVQPSEPCKKNSVILGNFYSHGSTFSDLSEQSLKLSQMILQANDFEEPGLPTIMSGKRIITQIKMQNRFSFNAEFNEIP